MGLFQLTVTIAGVINLTLLFFRLIDWIER